MTNILEYLEATMRRCPDKIAFSDGERNLSFRQLFDQSRGIGSFLLWKGLTRKPVVIWMGKQPRAIAACLGVVYSGCYYTVLDTDMPIQRVKDVIDTLQPQAILYDKAIESRLPQLDYTGLCLCYEAAAFRIIDEAALSHVRQRQLDLDPVYVVFTSGSTGKPKGVTGCHRGIIDYIENLCPVLGFSGNTVFGNQSPLYYDACFKEIFPTLKYGATTYLIPQKLFLLPLDLIRYLNRYKINTLCWVVSALTYLSSTGALQTLVPESVHTIAFASEVFPIRQLNIWRSKLPAARFVNLYGPTETTGICCWYEVNRNFTESETLPIGRPFPNTEILLLDEEGKPSPEGEICIRGSRLTLGYYNAPEQTKGSFVQNPCNPFYPEILYRTGDLGTYNSFGELIFLGRKDNQIKHMGHRIELGEIEAACCTHSAVSTCCCVFDADSRKIHLYYVGNLSTHALANHLKSRLPRYMIPNVIRQIQVMPLTANGKIDRNYLKQRSLNYGHTAMHSECSASGD